MHINRPTSVKEITKHHPKGVANAGYGQSHGCHGRPNGFALVSYLPPVRDGAGLPGGASGYQKMSGPCFLSHNSPIQAGAETSLINGLRIWPALPTRQNGALCLAVIKVISNQGK